MGRSGLTLVELLMYSVVMSLVGGAMLIMAQTGHQLWGRTDVQFAALTQAQQAMNRLTEDLRMACQSTIPSPCPTLTFKRSPSCAAPDDPITYTLVGSDLTRQVGVNPPVTVASGLKTFSPQCQSGGLVELGLTIEVKSSWGVSDQTLNSQVWVRNP